MIEVKATKTGMEREVKTLIDFGENVEDAIAKVGAEVVYTNYIAAAKVRAQSIMRDMLVEGKTDAEIDTFMASWKPGVSRERNVDPTKMFFNKFDTLTAEEQDAMLEQLMQKTKKAETATE